MGDMTTTAHYSEWGTTFAPNPFWNLFKSEERPMKCSRCEANAPQVPDGYWEAPTFGRGQNFSAEFSCSCCSSPLCEFCHKLDQYDWDDASQILIDEIQRLRKALSVETSRRAEEVSRLDRLHTQDYNRTPRFGWKK